MIPVYEKKMPEFFKVTMRCCQSKTVREDRAIFANALKEIFQSVKEQIPRLITFTASDGTLLEVFQHLLEPKTEN